MNPFTYGTPALGDNFCPRREEKDLLKLVKDHERILVSGHAAVGKTSLVQRLALHGHYLINWDLKYTFDLPSLEAALVKSLLNVRKSFANEAVAMLAFPTYHPRLEVSQAQELEFKIDVPAEFTWERLVKLLASIKVESGLTPVLVLDNVSSLKSYKEKEVLLNLLATLNNSYVGKIIFIDHLDAFNETVDEVYATANFVECRLDILEDKSYRAFTESKFKLQEVTMDENVWERVQTLTGPLLGSQQQLLARLYENLTPNQALTVLDVERAKNEVLSAQEEVFHVLFSQQTPLQKKLLKTMESNSKIYSQDFQKKMGSVSSNSIVKIVYALCGAGLLVKYKGNYQLFSPYFREWLRSRFN